MNSGKTERHLTGGAIDPSLVGIARQEYMAGASLRDLAEKHNIALRTLANYSKSGQWEMQRKMQRAATAVPALLQAADERAEAVRIGWVDRLAGLVETTTRTAGRVGDLLDRADMSGLDIRELVVVQKTLTENLAKLTDIVASCRQEAVANGIKLPTGEEAKAILARLRGEKSSRIESQPLQINIIQARSQEEILDIIPEVD